MNWQPIETAPKDGTVILVAVFLFGPDVSSAKWNGAYWDMRFMDDYVGPYDSQYEREFGLPAHWMPLPPPPENTK